MSDNKTLQDCFDEGFEAVKAYVDHLETTFNHRLEALEKRLDAQGSKLKLLNSRVRAITDDD